MSLGLNENPASGTLCRGSALIGELQALNRNRHISPSMPSMRGVRRFRREGVTAIWRAYGRTGCTVVPPGAAWPLCEMRGNTTGRAGLAAVCRLGLRITRGHGQVLSL